MGNPVNVGQNNTVVATRAYIRAIIPKRSIESHKGSNGHVMIVAGSRGMSGAAILSTEGALRAGAGLVTTAIVKSEQPIVAAAIPEALTLGLPEAAGALAHAALTALRAACRQRKVSVLAVGPGLSVSPRVRTAIQGLLAGPNLPLVLDADGLNNLGVSDFRRLPGKEKASIVITPHPGELARLWKINVAAVEKNRQVIAENTARELRVVCVLKGHRTVVSDGLRTMVNSTGNPAMATGGMGDVLTGVIAALIAQGASLFDAACAGVYLHGLAGDLARISDRGLLASEVAQALPQAYRRLGIR